MLTHPLSAVVEAAAAFAAHRRGRALTATEKAAMSATDVLSAIGSNPALAAGGGGLLGAGLGAGAGGLAAAFGNSDREPGERKSIWRSMLTGGLAGGALGAGSGLAAHAAMNLGGGSGGSAAEAPLSFGTDPATGKPLLIHPDALRADPTLADRVRGLTAPPHPAEATARKVLDYPLRFARRALGGELWNPSGGAPEDQTAVEQRLPFSSAVLPKVGLLDALLHAKGLNLGDRMRAGRFSFGRIDPRHATGSLGTEFMTKGLTAPGAKPLVGDLAEKMLGAKKPIGARGADFRVPGNPAAGGTPIEAVNAELARNAGTTWLQRMGNRLMGRGGAATDPVLQARVPGGGSLSRQKATWGPALSREQAMSVKGLGVEAAGSPGVANFAGRSFKLPGLRAGLAMRAPLYLGVPAAEYLIRSQMEDATKEKSVQDIIAKLREQHMVGTDEEFKGWHGK